MEIGKIKARLNQLGFASPLLDPTNQNFGNTTIAVVKKFQSANGLFADGKVGANTLAKLFPRDKVSNPLAALISKLKPIVGITSMVLATRAMQIAISQTGVRELTGKNDGEAVETYLKSVGIGKGYSWCMAFVFWCYQMAADQLGIANPLLKTGGCLRQRNEGNIKRSKLPVVGAIFIMDLGDGMGHTGIVVAIKGDTILTVEGNTNTDGSSNGNGVYYPRTRKISTIDCFLIA